MNGGCGMSDDSSA